jgi:hypothetical protein
MQIFINKPKFLSIMFKLTKGNPDELEGKVAIYSTYMGSDNSDHDLKTGQIFARYITIDPLDVAKSFDIPPEYAGTLVSEIKKKSNEILEKAKEPAHKILFMTYIRLLDNITLGDLLKMNAPNVIDAGNYHDPSICIQNISLASSFYFTVFADQQAVKKNISDILQEEPVKDNGTQEILYKRFFEVPGESIKQYVLDNFLKPLCVAHNIDHDSHKVNNIKRKLLDFASGSNFMIDIMEICDLVRDNEHADPHRMGVYLNKIVAIHTEKFETAREWDTYIKTHYKNENNQSA